MKPSSLVAILFRLVAIYMVFASVSMFVASRMFSSIFQPAPAFGGASIQMTASPFDGVIQFQWIMAVFLLVGGVLLYIWSLPLGRLIARGLD